MNETLEYEWSEELGKRSLDAYFRSIEGRPWLMMTGGVFSFCIGIYFTYEEQSIGGGFIFILLGTLFLLRPIRMHFYKKGLLKDAVRLTSNPTVHIEITDAHLGVSNSGSNRLLKWENITEVKQVNDFLLFLCGKTLVASLPVDVLEERHIRYIENVNRSTHSQA